MTVCMMRSARAALVASIIVAVLPRVGLSQATIEELRTRRDGVMARMGAGLLLVHASSGMKRWEESGFHQDPAFVYLTGLMNVQGAILLLDGAGSQSWLFTPPAPTGRDSSVFRGGTRSFVLTSAETERELGIDHVVNWDRFPAVVDSLIGVRGSTPLFVDLGGQTGRQLGRFSNPAGIAPIANPYVLWRNAIAQRWPKSEIKDAWQVLDAVRAVKSSAEILELRRAAEHTAAAITAAARAIRPGVTQREVEGAAIAAALKAGSDGPSLWPWIYTGVRTRIATVFDPFFDYGGLDRVMQAGETARVDLGFDHRGYKGDFGRTFPVSGRFTPTQREALSLLTGAYLAGADAIREGFGPDSVATASRRYVQDRLPSLTTTSGRAAAAHLLNDTHWTLHGLGLDLAEGTPRVFRAGNVICFEPSVRVDGEDLFVEDTFLVTKMGHELLNPALPYDADGLERLMRRR